MSAASLKRKARAYGWNPSDWHLQLAGLVHDNKVLHIYRHAAVLRDKDIAWALWFSSRDMATAAKPDAAALKVVFGRDMELVCAGTVMLPNIAEGHVEDITDIFIGETPVENFTAVQFSGRDLPPVIPVNDSRKHKTEINPADVTRAISRMKRAVARHTSPPRGDGAP